MTSSDVIIVGAGPAGLALGASLRALGVEPTLLDARGQPGGAFLHLYDHTRLASPTAMTRLPGPLQVCDHEYVDVATYRDYLARYAREHALRVERARVLALHPAPQGWQVVLKDEPSSASGPQTRQARVVVLATGMLEGPRWPPQLQPLVEAQDQDQDQDQAWIIHSHQWQGPPAQGPVVILGAATSAVEIAEECAQADLQVYVSSRSGRVKTWPQRLLGRDLHEYLTPLELLPRWMFPAICEHRPTDPAFDLGFAGYVRRGLIQVKDASTMRVDATRRQVSWAQLTVQPSQLVCATGYTYRLPALPDGVAWRGESPRTDRDGQSVSCPGLYVIGLPCVRTLSSAYLRGMARDAPVIARSIQARLRAGS